MSKYLLTLLMLFTCLGVNASDRMYIDEEELRSSVDAFYIHTGGNMWLETKCIHRDQNGLYTLKDDIVIDLSLSYKEKWKCPYCHAWWPKGQKCQDANCPSKYLIFP